MPGAMLPYEPLEADRLAAACYCARNARPMLSLGLISIEDATGCC
jgi:hypothetical protein